MKPHFPTEAQNLLTDASNLTYLIELASHGLNPDAGPAIHVAARQAAAKILEAIQILQGKKGGAS